MSDLRHRWQTLVTAGLLLTAVGLTATAAHAGGKSATRPYALALEVTWGEPVGPESWREDLERVLATELGQRHCYTSIERLDGQAATSPTLVLRVAVSEYLERSTYGVAIATLQAPDSSPDTRQSQFAEIKAMFDVALVSFPGEIAIRTKRFGDRATHRPRMNEDPRYESRKQMLESVRRTIAKFACKGSPEKFEKERAEALATAGRAGL